MQNPKYKSQYAWRKRNKKKHYGYMKKYLNEYHKRPEQREKYLARQYAYKNLRESLGDECSECGSEDNLEMHHEVYEKTKESVVLLCRDCHKETHRKNKKTTKNTI